MRAIADAAPPAGQEIMIRVPRLPSPEHARADEEAKLLALRDALVRGMGGTEVQDTTLAALDDEPRKVELPTAATEQQQRPPPTPRGSAFAGYREPAAEPGMQTPAGGRQSSWGASLGRKGAAARQQ